MGTPKQMLDDSLAAKLTFPVLRKGFKKEGRERKANLGFIVL